jgi:hypothetical protein
VLAVSTEYSSILFIALKENASDSLGLKTLYFYLNK